MGRLDTLYAMDERGLVREWETRPKTGACHNCGFLCTERLDEGQPSVFSELNELQRALALWVPELRDFAPQTLTLGPTCFRSVPIVGEFVDRLRSRKSDLGCPSREDIPLENDVFSEVATKDRRCPLWIAVPTRPRPDRAPLGSRRRIDMER